MAPTHRHGKAAFFSITDTGGSTINLSSGLDDCSLDRTCETAEITTYGDNDKVYLSGLRDATWSASGHCASTHEEKLAGLLGNSTNPNWVWGPQGNSTDNTYPKFTGAAVITALSVSAPVGDKVSFSISGQCSGAITSTKF